MKQIGLSGRCAMGKNRIFIPKKRGFKLRICLGCSIPRSVGLSNLLPEIMQEPYDKRQGNHSGRRSYGKRFVQNLFFSDNSGLRLTVARFTLPLGGPFKTGLKQHREYALRFDWNVTAMGELWEIPFPKWFTTRYVTPAGKVLYGGGGIIPDVFVPLDTVGVNDLYLRISRQNLPVLQVWIMRTITGRTFLNK